MLIDREVRLSGHYDLSSQERFFLRATAMVLWLLVIPRIAKREIVHCQTKLGKDVFVRNALVVFEPLYGAINRRTIFWCERFVVHRRESNCSTSPGRPWTPATPERR